MSNYFTITIAHRKRVQLKKKKKRRKKMQEKEYEGSNEQKSKETLCGLSASKGLSIMLLYNMVTNSDNLIAQFKSCVLDKSVAKKKNCSSTLHENRWNELLR